MAAIELHDVSKQYGDVTALRECGLRVEEGEIYGFLGPNGAGKSTAINVLLDFVRPTSGRAEVLGFDAQRESRAVRERVGVLPEGFSTYGRLSGRKHLEFAIDSKHADDDPADLAERVGIADAVDRKAGGYSTGMTQRLVLAMALVGDPDLLILDEPSSGLDPNGAREMREILREQRDRGVTVFFSSHVLGQVDAVCDRVGILRSGELVIEDSIEGLREATGAGTTLAVELDGVPDDLLADVRALAAVSEATLDGTTLRVTCDDAEKTTVLHAVEDAGATVTDFATEDASLEDLFTSYTTAGGATGRGPDGDAVAGASDETAESVEGR